jgi:hypothetical protein
MKRSIAGLGGAALLALLLAGCETVSDAPAGAYKVGTAYQVTLNGEWSDISAIMTGRPANVHLLSIDGPLLDRLYLSEGLKPGDFLVKPEAKDKPTPTYRAGMTPTELVEFVSDSVAALNYERVETSSLGPATFAGSDGLRFDITAKTRQGLDMSGVATVSEKGGALYVMLYLAPTEHYYRLHLGDAQAIMASARTGA